MGEPRGLLADQSPLIKAAWQGKLRLVRLLVEGGAQVNERNEKGETALMVACRARQGEQPGGSSREKLVKYLLEQGADPQVQDKAGRTALMHGCLEKAGPEVAALLLGAGADPGLEDYGGASALVHALNARDKDTLRRLLDACRDSGRDVLIISKDLSPSGRPVTRQYLNVPPSPVPERSASPVSCMSPSDIELKTGSPGSETEGEGGGGNVFTFKGTSPKSSPPLEKPKTRSQHPHLLRLRSEPWLAIHNLRELRSSSEESLRHGGLEQQQQQGPAPWLPGMPAPRRASLSRIHSMDSADTPRAPKGLAGRVPRKPFSFEKLPSSLVLSRRNTLPTMQDQAVLQLPCLTGQQQCCSDSHLPTVPGEAEAHRQSRRAHQAAHSVHRLHSVSTESPDGAPGLDLPGKRRQEQARPGFLPPLLQQLLLSPDGVLQRR
ncbi:ankyrin repeat domain-containing protein 34C-like [Acipenser ruthenus]|uniref:ankyrin repeat domain-containing protein 34C-like n=1 Tax=Acipenser ruthenus TaxID=7906 RepID=UPI00274192C4|nr:ankyrin repeat domain-containing protein 34C-like [Acipenser ruthenus]